MSEPLLCDTCRAFILDLLDKRTRKILGVADAGEEDVARAHCFHLMELERILRGEPTCGVFDDYGPPATIEGPLLAKKGK